MTRYFRRVIHVPATESPNVKLALAQIAAGRQPTNEMILPGVLTWEEYQKRLATWDKVRVSIGILAEFYQGAELLLFPGEWLDRSAMLALSPRLRALRRRTAEGVGIDTGEGGDKTAMSAVDRYGVIEIVSRRTPNTAEITGDAIAFMQKHRIDSSRVIFDAGGGGREHADRLRAQGYEVRTVAFGEAVTPPMKQGTSVMPHEQRIHNQEMRYSYRQRRAQLYHELSILCNPKEGKQLLDSVSSNGDGDDDTSFDAAVDGQGGFAIPFHDGEPYTDLRKQLSVIQKLTDDEGRYWLPSKGKVTDEMKRRNVKTLVDLIGHSPDEADSLVLAVHAMLHPEEQFVVESMV